MAKSTADSGESKKTKTAEALASALPALQAAVLEKNPKADMQQFESAITAAFKQAVDAKSEKTEKPADKPVVASEANVAGDCLCLSYHLWKVGKKDEALKFAVSAFESEDCETLVDSISKTNATIEASSANSVDDEHTGDNDDENDDDDDVEDDDTDFDGDEDLEDPDTQVDVDDDSADDDADDSDDDSTEDDDDDETEDEEDSDDEDSDDDDEDGGGEDDGDEDDDDDDAQINRAVKEVTSSFKSGDKKRPEITAAELKKLKMPREVIAAANRISLSGSDDAVSRGKSVLDKAIAKLSK